MRIVLPATINPPRPRKDGSASISFETREITGVEFQTIMGLRNSEGWLCYQPNPDNFDIPDEAAEVDTKSPSERLRNVLFVWYKQEFDSGRFIGLFETFRKEKMEKIIEGVKCKLDK